jgi:chromosome segregation ATPase
MVGQRLSRMVGVVGVLVLAVVGVLSAQALEGTPSGMAELLTEVRGLRADVNQAAGASMRMQLLVARLSLQEQRINVVGSQLADVNAQLDKAIGERAGEEARVKQLDADFGAAAGGLTSDAEAMRAQAKSLLSLAQASEQRLRSQAADLASLLATEQNRWTDFNGRLDDLEQSLPSATRR